MVDLNSFLCLFQRIKRGILEFYNVKGRATEKKPITEQEKKAIKGYWSGNLFACLVYMYMYIVHVLDYKF